MVGRGFIPGTDPSNRNEGYGLQPVRHQPKNELETPNADRKVRILRLRAS